MYMLLYYHILYDRSKDNLTAYPVVRRVIRTDLSVWVLVYITLVE